MGTLELYKYALWEEKILISRCAEFDEKIISIIKQMHKENGENSKIFGDWLKWCKQQNTCIKVIEHDVPTGILPEPFEGTLYDIKVQGKKWGPDDALYNENEDLRYNILICM